MSARRVVYNAEPLGFSPAARAAWEGFGDYVEGAIGSPALAEARDRTEVLIVRLAQCIDAAVLAGFPRLRWLVSATTGLDHLDLDAIAARNIEVVCLRGETEFLSSIPSTAEHTMALLFALLRSIPSAVASVRQGDWDRDRFRGRQLKGRRLGIVGLGRTGRMVARYAKAFDARVAYFDPHVSDDSYEKRASLPDLLRDSEILSLHVHLDESTRDMIGPRELALLPRGARIVNTSRGALIDEAALVASLRSGQVAGAAVDVLAGELEGVRQSALWQAMGEGLPVIVTPHIGGATLDAMNQCEEFIAGKCLQLASEAASS